jgi:hypothetical protein
MSWFRCDTSCADAGAKTGAPSRAADKIVVRSRFITQRLGFVVSKCLNKANDALMLFRFRQDKFSASPQTFHVATIVLKLWPVISKSHEPCPTPVVSKDHILRIRHVRSDNAHIEIHCGGQTAGCGETQRPALAPRQ